MSFVADEMDLGRTQIFGQIYSDNNVLEFNSFNFINQDSYLNFTGRIEGIDIFKTDFKDQLLEAKYDLDVEEFLVSESRINSLLPNFPSFDNPLFVSADFSGLLDDLDVNSTKVEYGNSSIEASGKLFELTDKQNFNYDLQFSEVVLDTADILDFYVRANDYQLEAISNATLTAQLVGDLTKTQGTFTSDGDRGKLTLQGNIGLADKKNLNVSFKTDSLNIGRRRCFRFFRRTKFH
jgi:hypothetical protein